MSKNILIVGASFGIGRQLALEYLEEQNNLILAARSLDKLRNLAGDNAKVFGCDVTNLENNHDLAGFVGENFKVIDMVIYCAGVYEPMKVENFELKKALEIQNVNFDGFVKFFDAILPLIKQKKVKKLAVTSSIAGYFGMPNSMCYGASKAALSNFVEGLYYSLKKYGCKVQLINPGFVKSRLTDKNQFEMPGILTTEKAAQIIVKGLESNRFEIKFPFLFANFMKLMAKFPTKFRGLIFK